MFKFKNPRDNALFMTGMTFGASVGFFAVLLVVGTRSSDPSIIVTPLIMGATMLFVTYLNNKKFKELDKKK